MTSGNGSSSFDVVVIGGSQAGLATGQHLARCGLSLCDDDAAFIAGRIDPHLENRTGRVARFYSRLRLAAGRNLVPAVEAVRLAHDQPELRLFTARTT